MAHERTCKEYTEYGRREKNIIGKMRFDRFGFCEYEGAAKISVVPTNTSAQCNIAIRNMQEQIVLFRGWPSCRFKWAF